MTEKKKKKGDPFKLIHEISHRRDVIADDPERINDYIPFLVNRAFSYHMDTVWYANMMNQNHSMPKDHQYSFYINIVRPKKRFAKWANKNDNAELQLVMEYFGYNTQKALQALTVLSDEDLETIRKRTNKGGTK
jgi:hypothetical protein